MDVSLAARADGEPILRMEFSPPLAWEPMLDYLSARAIRGVEHVSGGVYRRTIEVDGDPGMLEIWPGGGGHLLLRAHLTNQACLTQTVHRARHIFNLDADVRSAGQHLARDPVLAPLIARRPGLRVPGAWDPYELGVRAIIGQQVTVAGASTITARIVDRYGRRVTGLSSSGLTHLFPRPETLADAALSGHGLTDARRRAIGGFARSVAGGILRLDRGAGLDPLVSSLVGVPGVGTWTAQYLALRMGQPDAFPATDLGLRRAVARLTSSTVTPALLSKLADGWRPWRAGAAIHLWLAEDRH